MSSLTDRTDADLAAIVYSGRDWSETVVYSHAGVSRKINVLWFDKATVSDELGISAENAEPFVKCLEADVEGIARGDSFVRTKRGVTSTHYVTSVSEPEEGEVVVFISTDEPHG